MIKRFRGYTLLEVLVTLVVVTLGLLGMAGMVSKGSRAAYDAYQRQQALAIAAEMAERLRANQSPVAPTDPAGTTNLAIAQAYANLATTGTPVGNPASPTAYGQGDTPDCLAQLCSRAETVVYDIALWEGVILGATELKGGTEKIGGILNARGCIEGPLAPPSPPNTFRVSVVWQGDAPTAAPTTTACGQGLYRDRAQNVSDATRRAVSLDITLWTPTSS